ncbi:hypothetical protein O181_036881 [Austropuccinia psidii MF-1]|uniref:Integrase catalytic domain-containing protein n=1 Tax=Austropuccinia psidii MF-1 TaxID=1389203 RepID=A0A9Q3DB15_9BASI|nr:hypothetical protein [Austropuccinia psidii MF-1]
MDWVTALPPGGERSYSSCLVLIDRYIKTKIFLPCHKDDTAMETVIMIWTKAMSHTGLFQNIISDRDPKFTSAFTMIKLDAPGSRCYIWNFTLVIDWMQICDSSEVEFKNGIFGRNFKPHMQATKLQFIWLDGSFWS